MHTSIIEQKIVTKLCEKIDEECFIETENNYNYIEICIITKKFPRKGCKIKIKREDPVEFNSMQALVNYYTNEILKTMYNKG